jgi:hypothetical protein
MEDLAVEDEVEPCFRRSVVRFGSYEPLGAHHLPALAIVAIGVSHFVVGNSALHYVRDAVEVHVLVRGEKLPEIGHERAHVLFVPEVSLNWWAFEATEMEGDSRLDGASLDSSTSPSLQNQLAGQAQSLCIGPHTSN